MKSKILLSLALSLSVMGAIAQKGNVGIGTTKPDQSAILDVNSSNKGFLTPRMTLQQRNSIQSPAQGLMVYQTDLLSGFYFFDGKEWKSMTSETNANSVADAFNWGLTGNAGTNPATNFLGTTDAQPLVIKVNGTRAGYFDATSYDNLFVGKSSGVGAVTSGSPGGVASGSFNTSLGATTLSALTTGTGNVALGTLSLRDITTGSNNLAIGNSAILQNITGDANTGIGAGTLFSNKGSNNMALGAYALFSNVTGSGNIAIGLSAGQNATGSNNMFLGFQAGLNETSDNKLYIANSSTATPTIYGDFSANFVSIGAIPVLKRNAIATSGVYGLLVEKGILTEKLKVATVASVDWADYVFEKNYKMLTLEEVEKFVKENKHLPNVPSADDMSKNGLDVVSSDSKLLEKIEELTLYMIQLNKDVKELKKENEALKKIVKANR